MTIICGTLATFGCKSKEKMPESKTATPIVQEHKNQYVFLHLKEEVSPETIVKRYKAYNPQPMKPTSRTENNWRASFKMPPPKVEELLAKMAKDDDIIKVFLADRMNAPSNSKNTNHNKTAPIKRK